MFGRSILTKDQDEYYEDINRVCSILERVAAAFPPGSDEAKAIADAASAFTVLRQRQSLAATWRTLRNAANDDVPQAVLDKLGNAGITPDDLEDTPPKM